MCFILFFIFFSWLLGVGFFFTGSLFSAWFGLEIVFSFFIFRFLFVETFSWGGLGWPISPDGAMAYSLLFYSLLTYSFTKIFHSDYAPCIMLHIKDAACFRVTDSLFSHRCSSSSMNQS